MSADISPPACAEPISDTGVYDPGVADRGVPCRSLSGPSGAAGGYGTGPYAVRLEFFSGPMDLLLHLVHHQEVPIAQVQMARLAEQYLDVVMRTPAIDLERATEYLVIAATLLAIKSRALLPAAPAANDEEALPEGDNPELYEELRERLKAYELTKARAHALLDLPQHGVDTFSRNDRSALQPTAEMLAEPEEVTMLGLLFGKLMKRIGGERLLSLRSEPISIVSFMMRVVDSFADRQLVCFSDLVAKFRPRVTPAPGVRDPCARGVVIGTFIAVLELMKRGLVSATQADDGQIELRSRLESAESVDVLDSEFDAPAQPPAPAAGADQEGSRERVSPEERAHTDRETADPEREPGAKVIVLERFRRDEGRFDESERRKETRG